VSTLLAASVTTSVYLASPVMWPAKTSAALELEMPVCMVVVCFPRNQALDLWRMLAPASATRRSRPIPPGLGRVLTSYLFRSLEDGSHALAASDTHRDQT